MTLVPARPDQAGRSGAAGTDDDPGTGADAGTDRAVLTADEPGDTMSWWQDRATDDDESAADGATARAGADRAAVAAVQHLAAEQYPALVVQGLLLTGDRDTADDLAYASFARLRRDWHRLADADQAPAYLRGAVTTMARHRRPGGTATIPPADAGDGATSQATTGDADPASDPSRVRDGLLTVTPDEREALVLRHHLQLPEHEAALCLCTAVAPLRALVDGGAAQLRAVLGAPVATYDDAQLATLVASAGSDVVATLDPTRLAGALGGSRRVAARRPRRRRADAAWLLLGVLVGGAVAVGAVWRSQQGSPQRVATNQVTVATIVGRKATTTAVTASTSSATAVPTAAPASLATTEPATTATTVANDVLAVTVTPAPSTAATGAGATTASTRASTPRSTVATTVPSATTAPTTPPVPTASPTTAPAPATTVATTVAPTIAPTVPPTASPTTAPRGFALLNYGCARSDSSWFASGSADPALGTVTVSGPDFTRSVSIAANGTWFANGTSASAAQGSLTLRASAPGYSRSQPVTCTA